MAISYIGQKPDAVKCGIYGMNRRMNGLKSAILIISIVEKEVDEEGSVGLHYQLCTCMEVS